MLSSRERKEFKYGGSVFALTSLSSSKTVSYVGDSAVSVRSVMREKTSRENEYFHS